MSSSDVTVRVYSSSWEYHLCKQREGKRERGSCNKHLSTVGLGAVSANWAQWYSFGPTVERPHAFSADTCSCLPHTDEHSERCRRTLRYPTECLYQGTLQMSVHVSTILPKPLICTTKQESSARVGTSDKLSSEHHRTWLQSRGAKIPGANSPGW
jgi:hypothetical protein